MPQGLQPSYYCGTTSDQHSGAFVSAWGLDATAQLAPGQTIASASATIIDTGSGQDVTAAMLVGLPSVGPNAAGQAGTVVSCAVTGAVKGHAYYLLVDCVPSPPSPQGETDPLLFIIRCLY